MRVTFTREFMNNAVGLFIPLLVLTIASDLVSGRTRYRNDQNAAYQAGSQMEGALSKLAALTFMYRCLSG